MARNGISYSDVKQAIDEMQAEGLNPTIAGLRERLGTGSFTTISEHLKHWRAERQQQPLVAGGTPAPDNLNSMVQAVWQQAREDATKELESYKQEIQKTLEQAEVQKQEALEQALATEQRNKWLDERNRQLTDEIRLLEKQTGIAEMRLENLQIEKATLEQTFEQLELSLKDREQQSEEEKKTAQKMLKAQQEAFNHQLDQIRDDQISALTLFEQQLKEERQRSEASEEHWINQVDSMRLQLKEKEQKLDAQEKAQQQHRKEQQQAQSELSQQLHQLSQEQAKLQQNSGDHQIALMTQQKKLEAIFEIQEVQQAGIQKLDTTDRLLLQTVQKMSATVEALRKNPDSNNEPSTPKM